MIRARLAAALVVTVLATASAFAEDESRVAEGVSMYDGGRFTEAAEVFAPAAAAGNTAAQYHLGLMHARGEGVPKDLAAAATWFERAASGGHNHAQFLVGHMYAKGDGVPRDRARAHMWFTAATANGWWKAREARERLVDDGMTPHEVAEAGKLYRAWQRAQRCTAEP